MMGLAELMEITGSSRDFNRKAQFNRSLHLFLFALLVSIILLDGFFFPRLKVVIWWLIRPAE
jgi:hypothetical protein